MSYLDLKSGIYIGDLVRMRYVGQSLGETQMGMCIDAGCGPGLYREMVEKRGWTWYGFDSDPQFASDYVEHRDLLGCGYKNETFDRALCIDVLEHIADDTKALAELCRILKPGGQLILHTPNSGQTHLLVEPLEQADHVRHGYQAQQLGLMLQKAGFNHVHLDPTFLWHEAVAWDLSYCERNKIEPDLNKLINLKEFCAYGLIVVAWK